MSILGSKVCSNCNHKIPALEVFKVSMGTVGIPCKSCDQVFNFSNKRKWIAIFLLILIVFSPVTNSWFIGLNVLNDNLVLVAKYIFAGFVFYLINGRV